MNKAAASLILGAVLCARVSTDDLHGKTQKAGLEAVPCDLIFFEQESGANREAFAQDAVLVIAHNAGFDRCFVEKLAPGFALKGWACSQSQINWAGRGSRARACLTSSPAPGISMTSTGR
jgi:hypothetical protein